MRVFYWLFCGGAFAAVALSAIACNTIIGVEEVSASKPDAPALDCHIKSDFPMVSSDTITASLTHNNPLFPTAPVLDFYSLGQDIKLEIALYDNIGGTRVVSTAGPHPLTLADASYQNCGICVFLEVNYIDTDAVARTFHSRGEGILYLDKADTTGLSGRMEGLSLRHINIQDDTDADDGCSVTIELISFALPYSPAVAP